MPRVNTYAARPGSLFSFKDRVYKITENDTLDCILTARALEVPRDTIRLRYRPGDEIFLRWAPFTNKD